MNGNLSGFNANEVKPGEREDFAPIPKDDYTIIVEESEFKPNSKGTGHGLALVLQIVDGEFKGRKIWNTLNIDNPSQKAQQISLQRLSELCLACGIPEPGDSSELHNIPVIASISPDGEFNKVEKYKSAGYEKDSAPAKAAPAETPAEKPAAQDPATATATASNTGFKAPWKK